MRLPEPFLAALAVLRRALAVGALASVVALGTAACDEVLPDMEMEQGEDGDDGEDDGEDDGDEDEGQDEDGGDGEEDGDDEDE